MDTSICDAINLGWFILHTKGWQVRISKVPYISFPQRTIYFSNQIKEYNCLKIKKNYENCAILQKVAQVS